MTKEKPCCGCCCNRAKSISVSASHSVSNIIIVVLLALSNLPSGHAHIASVLEGDDVPGIPAKPVHRGPTVAPVPSPETLEKFEQIISDNGEERYFSPAEVIQNLLNLSSHKRLHGLKRVSQFQGDENSGLLGTNTGTYYRPHPTIQNSWDYDEDGMSQFDDEEKPTFVPYIGARALTNIPQFFEHLKENIEALKLSPLNQEIGEDADEEDDDDNNEDALEDRPPKKDITKPAARRMKTELLVDENLGHSSDDKDTGSKQNWKPRAAGIIHYYAPKANYLDSQQNILRRANNFNPAWLYTNLGLGKRRRRR